MTNTRRFLALLIVGLTIGYGVFAGGCAASSRVDGASVNLRQGRTTITPDGTVLIDRAAADAKGASAAGVGDETAAKIRSTAPTASLPGGTSGSGGDTEASASAEIRGFPYLLAFGVLIALGGGGMLYLGNLRAALIGFGLGGGLIVAAILPGFALFVVLGVAALAGGAYIYAEWRGDRAAKVAQTTHAALTNVFGGVRSALKDAPEALAKVRATVGERVRNAPDQQAIMDAIKRNAVEGS